MMNDKIIKGDKVNYHSLQGGDITSTGHTVTKVFLKPNVFDEDVAWLTGKAGCVSLAHLSKGGS